VRTDGLTGLANRREFMTQLERESHRQARSGRPMCVLLFDVDHFKQVNDNWGHPVGDEVLAGIGRILREHTRERVDTAARYGGEEFVLLLPETDLGGATLVADKIRARLAEQVFTAEGQPFTVTQSVGIAEVAEGQVAWALRVADRNLYQAKLAGRDRVVASPAGAEAG
jgi:diguanylate cyclase (GGDEF)-like protein